MEGIVGAIIGFLLSIPVVYKFVSSASLQIEEVGELLVAVADAVKDGKITAEEVKEIIEKYKDVAEVFRVIGERK